jgi:hypothetical protein
VAALEKMGKPVDLAVLKGQEHAFFSRQPWSEEVSLAGGGSNPRTAPGLQIRTEPRWLL